MVKLKWSKGRIINEKSECRRAIIAKRVRVDARQSREEGAPTVSVGSLTIRSPPRPPASTHDCADSIA